LRHGVRWGGSSEVGGLGNFGGQLERLAEGGEAGEASDGAIHRGQGRAEEVVEVIRQLIGFVDRMRGDRYTAARVRLDDVDRVVAAEQSEAVPEESFIRRFHRFRRFCGGLLNALLCVFLRNLRITPLLGGELAVRPVGEAEGFAARGRELGDFVEPAVLAGGTAGGGEEATGAVVGEGGGRDRTHRQGCRCHG